MYKQSASELGLKPGGLGGHQPTRIRYSEQFINGGRIHGKSHLHVRLYPSLQFLQATDSPHEINALVCLGIADAQDGS